MHKLELESLESSLAQLYFPHPWMIWWMRNGLDGLGSDHNKWIGRLMGIMMNIYISRSRLKCDVKIEDDCATGRIEGFCGEWKTLPRLIRFSRYLFQIEILFANVISYTAFHFHPYPGCWAEGFVHKYPKIAVPMGNMITNQITFRVVPNLSNLLQF